MFPEPSTTLSQSFAIPSNIPLHDLTVSVGYHCPVCGNRVIVLSSDDPPDYEFSLEFLPSSCVCGYQQPIRFADIQRLEIWRELKAH
jgi:hypothetical protein